MNYQFRFAVLGLLTLFAVFGGNASATELALEDALQLAMQQDPLVQRHYEKAQALDERAIASKQLPDPKLKLGLMNFPTDTFAREQEPMTQVQLGVQQMFPSGGTLEHRSSQVSHMADAEREQAADKQQKIRQQVHELYLETYYWGQAKQIVRRNQSLFRQLIKITRSQYAAGRSNQQDVIRAELELELLNDRQTQVENMEARARAKLARWIGDEAAQRPLTTSLPTTAQPGDYPTLLENLAKHPMLRSQDARVKASQESVAVARAAYKPKWMLDVTYGNRDGENMDGSDRADFLSAMVLVDIPLFKDKRQDRKLAASQFETNAALQTRELQYRELKRALDELYANSQKLAERQARYDETLISRARQNAEAALHAYQSNRGDFTMLMRARITALNTQLDALRIRVDYSKTLAGLLYLAGDQS